MEPDKGEYSKKKKILMFFLILSLSLHLNVDGVRHECIGGVITNKIYIAKTNHQIAYTSRDHCMCL